MDIKLHRIATGFKGNYCYTHARGALMPDGFAIITTQPLYLNGCDVFFGMQMLTSCDGGKNWSEIKKSETLVRKKLDNGCEQVFCDATPFYHKKSGTLLLTGHDAIYGEKALLPAPRPRHTMWSVFDRKKGDWTPFQQITMPDEEKFFSCGSGSGQICELENGDLLIPVYFMSYDEAKDPWHNTYHTMVMRCSFDGREIKILEYGDTLSTTTPRGLCEPSIINFKDRFFLAMRNDECGYVTSGKDGLNFDDPQVLCFDDGSESGNYNTQQHWLICGGQLYLVYTRKNAGNDHVFRHRAPLFIARFDTEKMCLIRSTERIVVPERGARLGNFGCVNISDTEAWVIASEWMQTTPPDPYDWTKCMKYGSDNSIFVAKVTAPMKQND